jgi:RNA polymerase sigma-70 factor (ECF subfamily)
MDEWAGRLAGEFRRVNDELAPGFDALMVECSRLAFRVAFSVLRHQQDAEDVAQEAFVKAHAGFAQLRDRERFRSWIVRMVWRMAIDRRRSDRRRSARELAHGQLGGTAAIDGATNAAAMALWNAIDALPEKLRQAIVLANIEGHEVADVAALLGIPVGTAKSRLFLARQRLKDQLQCIDTNGTRR